MQQDDLSRWQHSHDFGGEFSAAEKSTRRVLWLTAAMMVIEIFAGWKLGSMALFADGWHMGTHVAAFAISAGAYWMARRHAEDERFSFGTGKIGVLGAYTSAIILGMVALYMFVESVTRLFRPEHIVFGEAIPIACLGLTVNIVSAFILKGGHHHHGLGHDHGHDLHDHAGHEHAHDGHEHDHGYDSSANDDLNLRAAYIHVIADAVTSVLAIVALTCGKFFGLGWLDPVCGVIGSAVIGQWAWSLIMSTQTILLDCEPEACDLRAEIRNAIELGETRICDLHIWQVGVNRYSAIVSIVTADPQPPEHYRGLLAVHEELQHVTIEVNAAREEAPALAR
jgi:cation diffusion facilitator family transporter